MTLKELGNRVNEIVAQTTGAPKGSIPQTFFDEMDELIEELKVRYDDI